MIVRNEEKLLRRCVGSLGDVFSELCILDTGSDDRTVEVARALGARVQIDCSFTDSHGRLCDFGSARNAALDMATCTWVLQVDGDEVLEPGSHEAIRGHLRDTEPKSVACRVSSGALQFNAVRMFTRSGPHRYWGVVHEHLEDPQGLVGDPHIRIRNLPDKRGKETGTERDIRLCPIGIAQHPQDYWHHYYYARALARSGRWSEAITAYRRGIAVAPRSMMLSHALHTELASCCLASGNPHAAIEAGRRGLEAFQAVPETYCVIGDALLAKGLPDQALGYFEAAAALDPADAQDYPLFVDHDFFGSYPRERLELCRQWMERSA